MNAWRVNAWRIPVCIKIKVREAKVREDRSREHPGDDRVDTMGMFETEQKGLILLFKKDILR